MKTDNDKQEIATELARLVDTLNKFMGTVDGAVTALLYLSHHYDELTHAQRQTIEQTLAHFQRWKATPLPTELRLQ